MRFYTCVSTTLISSISATNSNCNSLLLPPYSSLVLICATAFLCLSFLLPLIYSLSPPFFRLYFLLPLIESLYSFCLSRLFSFFGIFNRVIFFPSACPPSSTWIYIRASFSPLQLFPYGSNDAFLSIYLIVSLFVFSYLPSSHIFFCSFSFESLLFLSVASLNFLH